MQYSNPDVGYYVLVGDMEINGQIASYPILNVSGAYLSLCAVTGDQQLWVFDIVNQVPKQVQFVVGQTIVPVRSLIDRYNINLTAGSAVHRNSIGVESLVGKIT